MGLVGGLLSPMVQANRLVLLHPTCFLMRPVSWLEYISAHAGTVSACPSFALDMCVSRIRERQLENATLDLSSLEFIWDGAEPVNPEAIRRFEARFAPHGLRPGAVQPAYGMAEAAAAVASRPPGAALVTRTVGDASVVSVGRPLGDFVARIIDDEGRAVPAGDVGEIVLQGESVCSGYYTDPEATRERFRDGWLHTGDLGLLDEHGEIFVTGRKKDLMIVRGRNFYGHDIAVRLDDVPFLQRGQHHVFSIGGDEGEQVIVMTVLDRAATRDGLRRFEEFLADEGAWVRSRVGALTSEYLADASPDDVDILRDWVRRFLLEEFGLPIQDVVVVRRIPRTSSGKVRRHECVELYREHVARRTEGET
jgi:acyl-CoA synthetase (AMP-forming)/AMP-acid ligase II